MNGKLAIVMNYMEDQNEPSRPDRELVFVPDDPVQRKAMLLKEWELHNEDDEEDEDKVGYEDICIDEDVDGEYGDIDVSYDGIHLLFTFVDLRRLANIPPSDVASFVWGNYLKQTPNNTSYTPYPIL